MKFKILRIMGVLAAAIGGVLIGFSQGMGAMYNETMGGLGLIEGGTLSYLDIDTLLHVEGLMSNVFPPSEAYAFAGAGLLIILIGILVAFSADRTSYRRASYLFLVSGLTAMVVLALVLGPPVLKILLGIKKGGQINIAPYVPVPTAWLAWTAFIFGVAFLCLVLVGGFLILREEEK